MQEKMGRKEKKLKKSYIENLCKDTWKDVYKYIYYKVLNREEAEDITQETYLKAIDHLENKSSDTEIQLGFLRTIALNILRDRWRVKKRSGYIINIQEISEDQIQTNDFTANTINKMVIEEMLHSLTFDQKRIIELRILKGFSVSETAKLMKKSEGAIRITQYRVLKSLAEKFNDFDI